MRLFLVILAVAGMAAGMVRCKPEEKQKATVAEVPVVKAATVKSMKPSLQRVLPGELKPWNKVHLYPKVKGYAGQVHADRGTEVRKGQLLVVLEAPEIVSALHHAEAQVASAEAALIEQRAKQKASRLTYGRIEQTSRTAGAVSANELDVAYSRMQADSALAVAAASNLQAARAQYASQRQLVEYLTVRAPFDGVITERNVSPGELVGPEGNTRPMFILEDRSRLRLTVAIPEVLANAVPENGNVSFTIQADPLKPYTARFARSANSLQETNRSMIAEFDVDNRDGDLKSGMYAEVRLPIARSRPTLFVPGTALIHSTEGLFIVRLRDSLAEWVPVQQGNSADSLIEVFGAIKEGDVIAKQAYEELRNGQTVKIR
jgi:RND family efflux transporter MFP subunit